jgi:hypothetical protein
MPRTRTLTLNHTVPARERATSLWATLAKFFRAVFRDFNRYADAAHKVHVAGEADRNGP